MFSQLLKSRIYSIRDVIRKVLMASEIWDPGIVCHSCCWQALVLRNGYDDVNVEDSPPALHQGSRRNQAEPQTWPLPRLAFPVSRQYLFFGSIFFVIHALHQCSPRVLWHVWGLTHCQPQWVWGTSPNTVGLECVVSTPMGCSIKSLLGSIIYYITTYFREILWGIPVCQRKCLKRKGHDLGE